MTRAVGTWGWMYRRGRKLVLDPPGGRLVMTVPKTLAFVAGEVRRGAAAPVQAERPVARPTPGLAAQVAMDELLIAAFKSPRRYPRRLDYQRIGGEVLDAVDRFRSEGWLDEPIRYHVRPPPLRRSDIHMERGRVRTQGMSYQRLSWESGYAPRAFEPGVERWTAFGDNRQAWAWVLRHEDRRPRPWVVCVHGFGTGFPMADFNGFRAAHLHRDLGLNLAFPVLPLHGPRRGGSSSGAEMMSFDILNDVHALAQAVWDVRRLVSWVRAQAPQFLGISGLSLGAYVAALTASIEPGLELVVAGIPAVDLPSLFAHHCPPVLRRRAVRYHLLGEETELIHRVVSPLAMEPLVARERRFIFAGLGDRMSTPQQAERLWRHWDEPRILWYGGNHVGYFWSRQVASFVDRALIDSGFAVAG